ncbi:bifunctional metallophosphatase/5'-nucleotidase [Cytobacillus sp. FJAT-54145]|uniref:Bifunctional metallophosphatase/5'-nucleotidase n=1 Tax=Cytobacillus spartinae TaxID=3299023 RepID=A0ABW6KAY4_9BACI
MVDNKEMCELVILETSDVHGNVLPINYGNNLEMHKGLAKLAHLINLEKEKHPYSLLIDNGDVIQGTPLTYHYAKFLSDQRNPIISILNELNFDAAVIGNHEFNYGLELLERSVKESLFPWLSANILNEKTKEPLFGKPYLIREFDNGLRVAILGLTTHYIPNWENPNHIKGIVFEDALESAKRWVNHLRENENYDLLVISYHGGFERDIKTGEPTETLTGENQGYQMCMDVEGIDILLTGHQHRTLADEINGVTILQPSFNGHMLGKVKVQFEQKDGKWMVNKKSPQLIDVSDTTLVDEKVVGIIEDYEVKTQEWLDQPMGAIIGDMTITDVMEIRLKDHPMIEFINKVQMDAGDVEISNTALFHNESPGFPNDVTMRDIVSNYIYPNTLKVIRITGQDMKDALEKCATYFKLDENNEISVNPEFIEPKPQHYNYDMWEGIQYELDIRKPSGQRVVKLERNGVPIELNGEYDVVMNNYRAGGGGDYHMYKDKPVIKDIQIDMTELIADYILKRKTIEATCNDNWKVIF